MKLKRAHGRLAGILGAGAASIMAVTLAGIGPASAITEPTVPSGFPLFQIGKVEMDRASGSDTTYFMMQKISDLYNHAALYGCVIDTSNDENCVGTGDPSTTDTVDNWDRNEELQGVDVVGSGAGQNQLCGLAPKPTGLNVDYSRSSKPPSACSSLVGLGYAVDGVPAVDFPSVNPSVFGAVSASSPYASVNGGIIGPVSAGWEPGDPVNGPYSGFALNSSAVKAAFGEDGITNNDNGGAQNSLAWRIYCETGGSQITDWGQLTNLDPTHTGHPTLAVGTGTPIGIPINIIGVNNQSGTFATYTKFATGTSGTGCSLNLNAASNHIALENNAAQLGTFAQVDYPTDPASQAVELASSLYYESNGVYNTTPFARQVSITNGTLTENYTASKVDENGQTPTLSNLFNVGGPYPTSRFLYNVYNNQALRASAAGFLNWICMTNGDTTGVNKQTDLTNGQNYDSELSSIISTQFGFPRITDQNTGIDNTCQLIQASSVTDPNS